MQEMKCERGRVGPSGATMEMIWVEEPGLSPRFSMQMMPLDRILHSRSQFIRKKAFLCLWIRVDKGIAVARQP